LRLAEPTCAEPYAPERKEFSTPLRSKRLERNDIKIGKGESSFDFRHRFVLKLIYCD
jgi:hypothetical protein